MSNDLSVTPSPKPVFRLYSTRSACSVSFAKSRRGWELLSNTEVRRGMFAPRLVKFLKDDESCLYGDEFLKCVAELGDCAGQRHAEKMRRNQNRIPKSWRRFMLIFPGTVWQSPPNRKTIAFRHGLPSDRRRVPCLFWRINKWRLVFYRIEYGFYENCRIIRIRQVVYQKQKKSHDKVYRRSPRRSHVIGECAKCGKKKFMAALGLCYGCYRAQLRRKKAAQPH